MMQEKIDSFLAASVRACLARTAMPPWPEEAGKGSDASIAARIKFHGIALLFVQHEHALAGWPARVAGAVLDEARLQALWEVSHRRAIVPLLDTFQAAGIRAVAMKGTATGYGYYADPAMRRRGDTDLLILGASRGAARSVLERCGFAPAGERAITQEPWSIATGDGFVHEVDIHWRIAGSVCMSRSLERLRVEERIAPLDRLAPGASSFGPVDNLILTCVNRYAHSSFGYHVEDDRLADGDRLIWAVDMALLSSGFLQDDWALLAELASMSGTAEVVRSGLAFAQHTLGLVVPAAFLDLLASNPGDQRVANYLGETSTRKRFARELAAAATPVEFLRLLRLWLLPGRSLLAARFPHAQDWPLWALHLRRLAGGITRRPGLPN